MSYGRFAAAAMICTILSACGGGSGGSGVGSTPTPSALRNSSLTNLQYSEDFTGRAALVQYSVSRATGGATLKAGGVNSSALVRYDATSQSYTLVGTTFAQSAFGASNRVASSSGSTITAYQKTNGNKREDLALFNAGAGNPDLALTYASYGAFQTITDNGSAVDVDTAFFTYGVLTTAGDMPRTGSATYRSKIDGQFADATGAYALSGVSSFAADFAAGTIAFSMTPIGQNVVNGGMKSFGVQTINGRISFGNQFEGATSAGGTYNSNLAGYFYGPAAAEIGGTFTLTGAGGVGAGALVGKKD